MTVIHTFFSKDFRQLFSTDKDEPIFQQPFVLFYTMNRTPTYSSRFCFDSPTEIVFDKTAFKKRYNIYTKKFYYICLDDIDWTKNFIPGYYGSINAN